jgi:hypothetical protein
MLFAATFTVKEGKSATLDSYLARRTQGGGIGKSPTEGRFEGIEIVGEYWVQSNEPRVILIFEAASNGPILELVTDWDEHFDITVSPTVKVSDLMKK